MTAVLQIAETPYADEAALWKAHEGRDANADGAFWVCVATTGVYCRPSCAGKPLRKNVIFVRTRAQAERAGYRACKRCRPDRLVIGPLRQRLAAIDWPRVEAALDARGHASLGTLLSES